MCIHTYMYICSYTYTTKCLRMHTYVYTQIFNNSIVHYIYKGNTYLVNYKSSKEQWYNSTLVNSVFTAMYTSLYNRIQCICMCCGRQRDHTVCQ